MFRIADRLHAILLDLYLLFDCLFEELKLVVADKLPLRTEVKDQFCEDRPLLYNITFLLIKVDHFANFLLKIIHDFLNDFVVAKLHTEHGEFSLADSRVTVAGEHS